MDYDNLTEEEQEFEDALTESSFANVPDFEERRKEAVQYAKNTLKRKQVTIRPYEMDLRAIKSLSSQL